MTLYKEYSDPERCRSCGGQCCLIYLNVEEGGTKPSDISLEDHIDNWEDTFHRIGSSKIKPLFDPLEVHGDNKEHFRISLLARGINPYRCKYCDKDGCILPWELRPLTCTEYRCETWEKEDNEHPDNY